MIALVRSVSTASMFSTVMARCSSRSQNTGISPWNSSGATEPASVIGPTTTSVPGSRLSAAIAV